MGYCIEIMGIHISNASQMQIGEDPKLIVDLLLVIVFLWVAIWSHGKVRSRQQWQDLQPRPSIGPWPKPHVKHDGLFTY